MIARLFIMLAMSLAFALIGLCLLERFNPAPPPLLVQADYRRCVTINNAPLVSPKRRMNGRAPISEIS